MLVEHPVDVGHIAVILCTFQANPDVVVLRVNPDELTDTGIRLCPDLRAVVMDTDGLRCGRARSATATGQHQHQHDEQNHSPEGPESNKF